MRPVVGRLSYMLVSHAGDSDLRCLSVLCSNFTMLLIERQYSFRPSSSMYRLVSVVLT